MKLERMLSMVIYLLQRGRVSAHELSDIFEVSVRTVYRDVESINLAGIPITAQKGPGGGIEIMKGYRLKDGVLTMDEIGSLESTLSSVASFYNDSTLTSAWHKVSSLAERKSSNTVLFDFTPWEMSANTKAFYDDLKKAIDDLKLVMMTYMGSDGRVTLRVVEPMTMIFKSAAWYLYAYCRVREDYRLFRLSRIHGVAVLDAAFTRREDEWEIGPVDHWGNKENTVDLKLRFKKIMHRRVYDEFPSDCIRPTEDGKLEVEVSYPENDMLYYYLLGFGNGLTVESPRRIAQILVGLAQKLINTYENS